MKYQIKIINYRPYEHELFQKKLNQLGQIGYYCRDLSLISIFKQVNHPVYYYIDFHKTFGKNRKEKKADKEAFVKKYIKKSYQFIYNKRDMYVFASQQEKDFQINLKNKKDLIDNIKRIQSFCAFIASLWLAAFFILGSLYAMNIDTFLSYGITFVYAGLVLLCLTAVFRCFVNFYYTKAFYKQLAKKGQPLSYSRLSYFRKIYMICSITCLCLIGGGFVEDTFNAQEFTLKEHPVLTIKDLGINDKSELSTLQHRSFTVPHSYSVLESTNQPMLYTKEYQLHSQKSAKQLMEDFKANPKQYYCTSVKEDHHILYGYQNQKLTTLIIQKENRVVLLSLSFTPTPQQIQKMINYYK